MFIARILGLALLVGITAADDRPKVQVTTGITWDTDTSDEELKTDRLNYKVRTTVTSLEELERFLNDQLTKDEMSVIVSFFEPDQIKRRSDAYLKFLSAGGIPQNAMYAFALVDSLEVPRLLQVPPPLPRSVAFSPKPNTPGAFEMRQAKFFETGQVFLDGVLPILATVHSGSPVRVSFPKNYREALGRPEEDDVYFQPHDHGSEL